MKNIIETEVWCYGKTQDELDQEENLGVKFDRPEDIWIPFSVDFEKVIAIKKALETEFLGPGQATLYLPGGEHITINMSYKEALRIWKGKSF